MRGMQPPTCPATCQQVSPRSPVEGARRRWGLHFSFDPKHLTNWDDGSEVSLTEREQIQDRIHVLLDYMMFPHSIDKK